MLLSALERITILTILPREENFATLKIVRALREGLAFTEEEYKELECKEIEGTISWNITKDVPKEISIGEKAKDIIVNSLKKLNEEKRLTDRHFSLYEKFVAKE